MKKSLFKKLWAYYNNPDILNPPGDNALIPENNLRFKRLFKEFKRFKIDKILDIGCNDGFFLSKIEAKEKYGVDVAKHILKKAKENNIKASYADLNTKKSLKFRNSFFDFILCDSTLEHIMYPDFTAKEIERLLKDKGYVFVVTDSADAYTDKLGFSKIKEKEGFNEHLHHFTKQDLMDLFKDFQLVKYSSFGFLTHFPLLKQLHIQSHLFRRLFFLFNQTLSYLPLTKNLGAMHFCLFQKKQKSL